MRIIWQRALCTHVLDRGIPFPNVDVDTIDCSELEVWTRRAFKLGQFWLNRTTDPRLVLSFAAASSATGISAVRFLPAHPDWLITLTKGIWSLITCWDIGTTYGPRRKIAEWSPRQTLITDIAVNSDPHSEAHLAVSLLYSGFVYPPCCRQPSNICVIVVDRITCKPYKYYKSVTKRS